MSKTKLIKQNKVVGDVLDTEPNDSIIGKFIKLITGQIVKVNSVGNTYTVTDKNGRERYELHYTDIKDATIVIRKK